MNFMRFFLAIDVDATKLFLFTGASRNKYIKGAYPGPYNKKNKSTAPRPQKSPPFFSKGGLLPLKK